MTRFAVLALLTLTAACASPRYGRAPVNTLDRSLFFSERTAGHGTIPMSGDRGQIESVPEQAEIDINSTIVVEVRPEKVILSTSSAGVVGDPQLTQTQDQLREAIKLLADLVDARLAAVQAYRRTRGIPLDSLKDTAAYQAFLGAAKQYSTIENKLSTMTLWDDVKMFSEDEQQAAFIDPTYQTLGALLQRKLDETEQQLRNATESAKMNAGSLRIEAFLDSANGSPTPIHLPGYDRLDEKQVQLRDPDALVMSEEDRKSLTAKLHEMDAVATQANRLKSGEQSLRDALLAAGKENLARFESAHQDLKPLLDENWPALAKQLNVSLKDFEQKIKKQSPELGQAEVDRLTGIGRKLAGTTLTQIPNDQIQDLGRSIAQIKNDWKRATPDTAVATLAETASIPGKARSLAIALMKIDAKNLHANLEDAINEIQESTGALTDSAQELILADARETRLLETSQHILDQMRRLQSVSDELIAVAKFATIQPVHAEPRVSESYDVPLLEAPRTMIDLQRTSRILNDRIFFRATLTNPSSATVTSEATFDVQQFGKHTTLAPSVVLARPITAHSSSENDFKFAPALAFLYRYTPRNSEKGWLAATQRALQLGGGLHVAFLTQNPGKDTEIGMGVAASIWQDRIVAGYGWNLMNNSNGYVYIGSNLIPVLQALGFGNAGGAGKKP